jgi:hypothetical protein
MAITGGGESVGGITSSVGMMVDDLQNMHESIQGGVFDIVSAIQKRKEREERARMEKERLEENRRQFNRTAAQDDRTQNMQGIAMLAEQRGSAEANAKLRTFRKGLTGL